MQVHRTAEHALPITVVVPRAWIELPVLRYQHVAGAWSAQRSMPTVAAACKTPGQRSVA